MLKSLGQDIQTEGLLAADDSVVVGVSGGADSMALLHLLLELNRSLRWRLALHVAHLNHRLRGADSEKDAAFVQAAADSLEIPCFMESVDVAGRSRTEGIGAEELGRRERYAFFERVCEQVGATVVALGHHADDQAETILHRILRGTGLRGLAGMPWSRPIRPGSPLRVVRPLLRKNRAELRSYLADTGVAFREDRSNQSNEPLRNRLRNRILPLLEAEVNPQVREALMRLGEQAHWLAAFLGETVERTFETLIVTRTDRVLVLNAEAMGRKSRIVQTELVRTAYRSFGLGEQELSFAHMVSALDLIADPAGGKQVQLPGGLIMEKRYGQISFALESDEPREMLADEVTVRLPGVTVLPMRKLEIVCEPVDVEAGAIPALREAAHRMQEYVDLDSVRPPLTVRKRRSGERFFPLGAPGTKKLSDFLNEAKIAPVDRDHVAVLCDQLGPIWVIGLRIDDRVKLTSQTRRVLRLFAQRITD